MKDLSQPFSTVLVISKKFLKALQNQVNILKQVQCILLLHKNITAKCYIIPPPTILEIILYVMTYIPVETLGLQGEGGFTVYAQEIHIAINHSTLGKQSPPTLINRGSK